MLQIFVLAAVAIFLFWRLRAVLGSRDGFEKNIKDIKASKKIIKSPDITEQRSEAGPDDDIFDYVEDVDLFMTHCEQATLSLVANILKIETGPHPSDWPAYYMFHMIGNHVFEYLNIKKSSVQAVPDSKKYIKRIIMADMLSKIDEGMLDLKKWFKQKK